MAGDKYLYNNAGQITEKAAKQTTAGAGDAGKIPALNAAGVLDPGIVNATIVSAGAGDSGKIPELDSTGKLDTSVLPSGVGAATATITATENLAAGAFVDIYISSGIKCRNADVSASGKYADGFVLAAVTSGQPATVYFPGALNTQLTGLTAGTDYFMDPTTPGGVTATCPTTAGQIVQKVGTAVSTTTLATKFNDPILLA